VRHDARRAEARAAIARDRVAEPARAAAAEKLPALALVVGKVDDAVRVDRELRRSAAISVTPCHETDAAMAAANSEFI
jgi:hypothetical protein